MLKTNRHQHLVFFTVWMPFIVKTLKHLKLLAISVLTAIFQVGLGYTEPECLQLFTARCTSCRPTNSFKALKGKQHLILLHNDYVGGIPNPCCTLYRYLSCTTINRLQAIKLSSILWWQEMMEGYWHQRADERHGKPPQGNQELLVVRDKVGRPQVSLG